MIKGAKNKRILIPKNSIKTPSKSTENKAKKNKKRKGAESCRIEKYLKNAEKFHYPGGSSQSIHNQDSTHFATIDSNKVKILKKNKIINTSNLSRKIKKRKEIDSIKSGEFQMENTDINLSNVKNFENINIKALMTSKRKSLSSEQIPVKKYEKVYKVKHNNSKKRPVSKSKSKGPKPKYQLSSYAEMLQNKSKIESKGSGLIPKDNIFKLSHIFDFNVHNNKKNLIKKKVKL